MLLTQRFEYQLFHNPTAWMKLEFLGPCSPLFPSLTAPLEQSLPSAMATSKEANKEKN